MTASITNPRSRSTARPLALTSLGVVGLSLLAAACSGSPNEATASGESALSGNVKPMVTWSELLLPASDAGQITNTNGGCLDLPNGDTTNGNLLHIWACDTSGWNQTWFVDRAGSIHYAANPEKCVDFPAQSLVNGVPTDETQLQIWDCNGASGPDQVWHFTLGGNIQFGADTAKCVELRDGSSADNTPVQVFDCNGTSGQTWQLAQVGTSLQGFQLQDANGACLEPLSSTDGASLILAQCNGSVADQQWIMSGKSTFLGNYPIGQSVTFPSQDITSTTFVPETQLVLGSGTQVAMNPSNHTVLLGGLACMEARGGSAATGTVVQGFTCNGTSGQTWFPKPMGGTCPGTVASNGTCNPCPSGTVLLDNACLPSSHTWTFPETDGSGFGVHPQTVTVNWDGSWSWQGQFWMNAGPFYWSADDLVIVAFTTSAGQTYYLQHAGTLSGFGNSSDPGNGDWNDSGGVTYSPFPGDWEAILNAKVTTKGEANTTAAGILGDLGIVAGTAVMIGAASY